MLDDFLSAVGATDIAKISEPVIYMQSNKVVSVSNILGVISLESDNIILLLSKHKNMLIQGKDLICKSLNKNEIIVDGNIVSITFNKV